VFFFAEFATAVVGWVLGINPFDQPNVQEAKDNTKRVLSQLDGGGELQEPPDAGDEQLRALLTGLGPPSYVSILGYLPPSEDVDAAVTELRAAVRDATRTTTTFGYGPRYLHSTGQFHKGGPPTGRFLELVARHGGVDADVPGEPFTFAQLIRAQAIGDLETLRGHDLPAERVTLPGDDPAGALRALTAKIKEML
jgi:glucose-6-phosphate isomerase/transaldolase/glucose-6-phosphate isomerase